MSDIHVEIQNNNIYINFNKTVKLYLYKNKLKQINTHRFLIFLKSRQSVLYDSRTNSTESSSWIQ